MVSIPDMALLGVFALLVFGPEQLPRVARKAGSVMREIQNTSQSFIREMERAADVSDAAEKKPYEAAPYEPVPYEPAAYDASAFEATTSFEAVSPDSSPGGATEKLAEPRPALGLQKTPGNEDGAEPFDPPPSKARAAT